MAVDQIALTPDEMRSLATSYQNVGADVEQSIETMKQLMDRLQQSWKGGASDAYGQKFLELKKNGFDPMKQLIDDISTSLNNTAQAYEQADTQIANAWKNFAS